VALHSMDLGDNNIQAPKFFFGVFLTVNFFSPKLMKTRWFFFFFFGCFAHCFQINSSTHGSNLNSMFVIMSELKFFLLMWVLIQNFDTVDLVKFL
jgi:hypothetical protein